MYKFFKSPLPPADLIVKFSEFTDPKVIDPTVPSLYKGDKAIITEIKGATSFRAQKRLGIGWGWAWFSPGFWFKPVLSGTVTPLDGGGSAVIFEGGTPIPTKVIWTVVFLIIATLGSMFLTFNYPANINFDGLNAGAYMSATIMAMNTVLGILLLLPLIGWWLTRNDLAFVAAAIERNLQLHSVPKTTLD
jgi:hypothetical protein